MSKERLAVLLAYMKNQRLEINNLLTIIKSSSTENEEKTVYLGYMLHNLYCALEDIFKRVAEAFENNVDDLSRYHRDLLRRMSFELPGVRPALLTAQTYRTLDELRRFRHLFRHAYAYQLDPRRVAELQSVMINAKDELDADFENYKRFLTAESQKKT
ncbi:MAG: ribonuclease toxin HepT-like protein [Dethiobacteraceae bacterium]